MSSHLFALGAWAYAARRLVLVGWLLVLGCIGAVGLLVGTGTEDTYEFPGTESQDALDALARTFPQFAGTSAQLVAVAPSGGDVTSTDFESAVNDTIDSLQNIPQVSSVGSPYDGSTGGGQISSDNSAVLVPIDLTVDVPEVLPSTSDALQQQGESLAQALPEGSSVAVGGQLYSQVEAGIGLSELASLGIALVVLLFTFGSLVAAGLPLVTAVIGVGVAVSIVFAATRFLTITSTAPLLAVMLGLAVGIDYGLFVLSRHRDQMRDGMSPEESAPRAVATAGSAVVFAATTVVVALLGLTVARIPFLTITGVSAALAVTFAALVSLTLTPALLGFAGHHVLPRRHRPDAPETGGAEPSTEDVDPATTGTEEGSTDATPESTPPPNDDGANDPAEAAAGGSEHARAVERADEDAEPHRGVFFHWVRVATKLPLLTVLIVIGALVFLAVPAKDLRLALPDAGTLPEDEPGRVAYDLISESFGPGYNGPLLLTGSVIQSTDPVTLVNDIAADISRTRGVVAVPTATPNETGDTAVIQVISDGAPDSAETQDLVKRLRADQPRYLEEYAVDLSVTGYTAVGIDISSRLSSSVIPFGLLVVGLSIVLLMMVFRSVIVPLAAALGYALSIAATLGILSRVYIDGFGADALGVTALGSVTSFAPIIIMGVLFGLAMDYEIFLVSRMREDYAHNGEPRAAVERGFMASARVVTPAAIIMATVFVSFVPGGEASLQPIALGLALGVVIDAFVVRMILTPAVLVLFGRFSWWLPAWLDRLLPDVDVEGKALEMEDALADWPRPGAQPALALDDVRWSTEEETGGVTVEVEPGEVLILEGGTSDQRDAALLALTGRLRVMSGRCKVAGYVLPSQASWVRARSAVALLEAGPEPVRALLDVALDGPEILAIGGADTVTDPATFTDLADVVTEARDGAEARGVPMTFVIAGASAEPLEGLVSGDVRVHVVDLDSVHLVTHAGGPD